MMFYDLGVVELVDLFTLHVRIKMEDNKTKTSKGMQPYKGHPHIFRQQTNLIRLLLLETYIWVVCGVGGSNDKYQK